MVLIKTMTSTPHASEGKRTNYFAERLFTSEFLLETVPRVIANDTNTQSTFPFALWYNRQRYG
jgi:hypothetical protein